MVRNSYYCIPTVSQERLYEKIYAICYKEGAHMAMERTKQTALLLLTVAVVLVVVPTILGVLPDAKLDAQRTPLAQTGAVLWEGSTGSGVREVQTRLKTWGYYTGSVDGIYGSATTQAVMAFQRKNGLKVDGVVGQSTRAALGLPVATTAVSGANVPVVATATSYTRNEDLNLLSRLVAAEAQGEPLSGQVAVAAVILNRVRHPSFPNTLSGVVYQPHAFESVSNGLVWKRTPSTQAVNAARQALNGWDPTYGCIFFWNPSKPVSAWIWSRQIIARIGNHVFAK